MEAGASPSASGEPSAARAAVEALEAWAERGRVSARSNAAAALAALAGDLTLAQRLTLCAYAHLAAAIDPALTPSVGELARACRIDGYANPLGRCLGRRRAVALPASAADLLRAPPARVVDFVTGVVAAVFQRGPDRPRCRLEGLKGVLFEHPEDRRYLNALRAVPGFDTVLAKVIDLGVRADELRLLSSNVRVTADSIPSLYELFEEACEVLDVSPRPEFYVEPGALNAYTTGVERPIVVLSSSMPSVLTRDELLFVIGHELGHVKSGHVLYGAMARWIGEAAKVAGQFSLGLAQLLSGLTVEPALYAWYRRSEYTADRAGLLACQDLRAAISVMAKLAGYPPRLFHEMDPGAFAAQARAFDRRLEESHIDRVITLVNAAGETHPRSVQRAAEMLAWVEAGEYEDIVNADADERRALARAVESDPLQDVVLRAAAIAIGAWASEAAGPAAREAARTARRMMRYGTHPLDPTMSRVFRVEVEVERVGADDVQYRVRLLTLGPSGAPTRVTLDLPERAPWTTVPTRLRESFVRENQRALTFELYRALPAGGGK